MDPNATYTAILESDDPDEQRHLAAALLRWLRNGGFPPSEMTSRAAIAFCKSILRGVATND